MVPLGTIKRAKIESRQTVRVRYDPEAKLWTFINGGETLTVEHIGHIFSRQLHATTCCFDLFFKQRVPKEKAGT